MTTETNAPTRLPRNSHALWVYSGPERYIYQVVEPGDDDGNPKVMIYALEHERWLDGLFVLRRSWTRGSSRALADALAVRSRTP
jgi:hypothetical protein